MKDSVGATIGRPQILPKQNLSPQGENAIIFLGEIRKSPIFGGRAMLAPTAFWPKSSIFVQGQIV